MRALRAGWFRTTALAIAAAAAAACETLTPLANATGDITGEWAFSASLSPAGSAYCTTAGSFMLTQQRPALSGSAYQSGSCAYAPSGEIANGVISGSTVHFSVSDCVYTGTVYDDPPDWLRGTVTCGTPANLAQGSWSAQPAGPLASMVMQPPGVKTVPGASFQATVQLFDARKVQHQLGRPLTWSSDNPSVATVTATGLVTAVGTGSAQITVKAPEMSASWPISVALLRFASVSAGGSHSCGLTADGPVYCWGTNDAGQLGDGAVAGSTVPVGVAGDPGLVSVVAGAGLSCGLVASGAAYCWGGLPYPYSYIASLTPTPLSGGTVFSALAAEDSMYGLGSTGTAFHWGADAFGRGSHFGPAAVPGSQVFAALATGGGHACGLTADGSAWCWGSNSSGELGSGDSTRTSSPVAVAGGRAFISLAAGTTHTCGLVTGGAAWCWGNNRGGQFGDGSSTSSLTPVPAAGGKSFVALSASHNHTCGLGADGRAWCWGSTLAGTGDTSVPVQVGGGLSFTHVSAGADHACGLATDGFLYCWGRNTAGQLGDGTMITTGTPVRVAGQH
jgi:alpha-tubulin suppressor-like RCC1 family protein